MDEITTSGVAESIFKIDKDTFWKNYDSAIDTKGRVDVIRKQVRECVRATLKIKGEENIDGENLSNLGMDSLMKIEMSNQLQILVGDRIKLQINSVKDCNTIDELATR